VNIHISISPDYYGWIACECGHMTKLGPPNQREEADRQCRAGLPLACVKCGATGATKKARAFFGQKRLAPSFRWWNPLSWRDRVWLAEGAAAVTTRIGGKFTLDTNQFRDRMRKQ
jgi:hypothetical protein